MKRWDLSTLEHASHWAVHLYAAMGFYALTLGGDFSFLLQLLAAGGWLVSLFAPRDLPARGSRIWGHLLLGHLAIQALRFILGGPGLMLALEFAASLQWVRLWTRRVPKDDAQIALLAFLHLIAGTVLTTSLAFGVVFIVFVLTTPLILFINHLGRTVGQLPQGRRRRLREEHGFLTARFAGALGALAIPTFVMTTALFLLFPRVGLGLAAVQSERGQTTTGFSDNVTLGGFGTIRQDPTIVMRVFREKRARRLRMRGTSFDYYDGRTWSQPFDPRRLLPWSGDALWLRSPESNASRQSLRVVLEPLDQPILFVPLDGVLLRMDRHPDITLAQSSGTYRYPLTSLEGLRYTVELSETAPLSEDHIARPVGRHLRVPEGHERVAELAAKVAGESQRPRDKARRLLHHLRDSGVYRYSLDLPRTQGRVPLDVFLFEAKAGHCEYFSTSLAIMLRAVGISSRNVTGFVGGAVNPYGGYEVLRQADAHSWVEAFYDGRWHTLDPTPPVHAQLGPEENWLSNFNAMMDAIRQRWGNYVVGYDRQKQFSALRKMMRWWRRRDLGSDDGPAKQDHRAQWDLPKWSIAAVITVLFAFLLTRYMRRKRKQETILDLLDRRWSQLGRPRPPAVTQLAHARTLLDSGEEVPDIVNLVEEVIAERFGAPRPERDTALRARIRQLPPRRKPSN